MSGAHGRWRRAGIRWAAALACAGAAAGAAGLARPAAVNRPTHPTAGPGRGVAGDPVDVSEMLTPIRAKHHVPALAAMLVTSDRIVAQGVVGVRRNGDSPPAAATLDDQWHLGSCTKSMTATLCALLVEQGRVKWSTTLAEVFPDAAGAMDPGFRTVTLEQLCTNRGGFPASLDADGVWGKLWAFRGSDVEARRLLLTEATKRPPAYAPGTKFLYSNTNFAIAGHVAETVAGKPYDDLLREMLFEPLGMTSAGFGAPGHPGAADEPRGHGSDGKPIEPTADGRGADNPPAITPAGRVRCSLADWAKYVQMHLRGARGEDQKIGSVTLPAAVFKKLRTPPTPPTSLTPPPPPASPAAGPGSPAARTPESDEGYAFGWGIARREWAGPKGEQLVLTHNGSNTMWFCVVWIAPAKDFAVLACTNTAKEGDTATDEAAAALIREQAKLRAGVGATKDAK